MKNIIFILFILYSFNVHSQKKSVFYNQKGQLYLDTTLTITKSQYKIWAKAEDNLIAKFSNIKFPEIYLENNIKAKGILIASFICDTSNIKDVKVIMDSSGYPAYSLSVIKGVQDQGKSIAAVLRATSSYFSSVTDYMGKYYVAFDFMIIDFYEHLKKRKAVPIIKSSIPTIYIRSH